MRGRWRRCETAVFLAAALRRLKDLVPASNYQPPTPFGLDEILCVAFQAKEVPSWKPWLALDLGGGAKPVLL